MGRSTTNGVADDGGNRGSDQVAALRAHAAGGEAALQRQFALEFVDALLGLQPHLRPGGLEGDGGEHLGLLEGVEDGGGAQVVEDGVGGGADVRLHSATSTSS